MENAIEALKIAFGIIMFVLALTLGISSFSKATSAVEAITTLRDRETEYTYVEQSNDSNRVVGVETVIPTMYKAYKENFRIVFLDKDENPLYLYTYTNPNGATEDINYIDLEQEVRSNAKDAVENLDKLFKLKNENPGSSFTTDYAATFTLNSSVSGAGGLYKFLEDKKFKEVLGEYYQEDQVAGTETSALEINKTKKRVITYILQEP